MPHWETIITLVIVAVALFWGFRAAWRSVRKGQICSDCSDSGSCPMVGNPDESMKPGALHELSPRSRK
jgi:FeoB-associated Cys-rich membrane protein